MRAPCKKAAGIAAMIISEVLIKCSRSLNKFNLFLGKVADCKYLGLCPNSSTWCKLSALRIYQFTCSRFSERIFTKAVAQLPLPNTPKRYVVFPFKRSKVAFMSDLIKTHDFPRFQCFGKCVAHAFQFQLSLWVTRKGVLFGFVISV